MASTFFTDLYHDSLLDVPYVLHNVFPHLNVDDFNSIGRNISDRNIKEVVFYMGSFKAQGRDRLQAIFYQSQWDQVDLDLCSLVHQIFANPKKVEEVNETLITLIPKTEQVTSLKQMRPISLCNVSYKIITKIIANRLRKVMEKLVTLTQCSFISGRHSTDNIIITQEVIHSMRNKKKSSKDWMGIKIDL
ncbi:LINE-1 retrotransposable element ORF2 protein [Arachis hypogaea]|nr:LINE-1 retrotransposable element ORF2 protein [Arachis hypogaea]